MESTPFDKLSREVQESARRSLGFKVAELHRVASLLSPQLWPLCLENQAGVLLSRSHLTLWVRSCHTTAEILDGALSLLDGIGGLQIDPAGANPRRARFDFEVLGELARLRLIGYPIGRPRARRKRA